MCVTDLAGNGRAHHFDQSFLTALIIPLVGFLSNVVCALLSSRRSSVEGDSVSGHGSINQALDQLIHRKLHSRQLALQ